MLGLPFYARRSVCGADPNVRVLMIDNYDSFTYNLVQRLAELGAEVEVVRNDEASLDGLEALRPEAVVISPGPGRPREAGVSVPAVRAFAGRGIPVLGVCLGHQALGVAFGARVVRAARPMHGKTSAILHDGTGVFHDLACPLEATRYHSLVLEGASLPDTLHVSARTEDGEVMAVRHATLPAEGVQFHPESIVTREGKRLLGNFLARCRASR